MVGIQLTQKGIVFGTSSDPSVENDTVVDAGPGIGSENNIYIILDENTLYYYRAFATQLKWNFLWRYICI